MDDTKGYVARALAEEGHSLVAELGFGHGKPIIHAAHDMGAAALLWSADHPSEVAGLLHIEAPVVRQSVARKTLDIGLAHYGRGDLEAVQNRGEMLHINVLGLATVARDVTPELARATIASVTVLGALHASAEVKAALADRTN
ncbi:hypothetical protein [Acidisoma sp. L85]|uniref:hypothetical protein n=1 Tax=Acidisoma sp. L85 TaxID=1641850 RepID=UPI0020B15DA1|nr:hypothetical protein [Acidisoma sp. L85]